MYPPKRPATHFAQHVVRVVFARPQKQMLGINTCGGVALVADEKSGWNRAIGLFPHNPVGLELVPTTAAGNDPVPALEPAAGPKPASGLRDRVIALLLALVNVAVPTPGNAALLLAGGAAVIVVLYLPREWDKRPSALAADPFRKHRDSSLSPRPPGGGVRGAWGDHAPLGNTVSSPFSAYSQKNMPGHEKSPPERAWHDSCRAVSGQGKRPERC